MSEEILNCYQVLGLYEYDSIKSFELSADYRTALEWYLKAADQGHAKAQLAAGRLYRKKYCGVATNYKLAIDWIRRAAAQGLTEAESELGWLHHVGGSGLEQDDQEAAVWYRRAAEKGDAYAQLTRAIFKSACRCSRAIRAGRWWMTGATSLASCRPN